MHTYSWSCLACGVTNTATSEACSACGCPATPTLAEIEAARSAHVQLGGHVLPSAGIVRDQNDLTASQVLIAPVAALLFGILPGRLFPRSTLTLGILFLLCAFAFGINTFSVMNWGWPPVGFEAAPFIALLSIFAAILCAAVGVLALLAHFFGHDGESGATTPTPSASNEG